MSTKLLAKMAKLLIILASIIACSLCDDDEPDFSASYTKEDFEDQIPKNNHFIMFYAPWCEHCQTLYPIWSRLTNMFLDEANLNVTIAKVDCTTETPLCSEQEISEFPTLKFYKKGETEGIRYHGAGVLDSFTSFIYKNLGIKKKVKLGAEPKDGHLDLTEDNFYSHIANGKHFIQFYAPWCTHCQEMAPTWEELSRSKVLQSKGVSVRKVDCTQNQELCITFGVNQYPTMIWFENGKKVEEYESHRTLDELVSFASCRSGGQSGSGGEEETSSDSVPVLTGTTFDKSIASGISFIKFFAPWCGHCKKLAPAWKELALKFQDKENVVIAKVDCTKEHSKELCILQEANAFPTLLLYRDGKKVTKYAGSRSLEDLLQFVNKHLPDAETAEDEAKTVKEEL